MFLIILYILVANQFSQKSFGQDDNRIASSRDREDLIPDDLNNGSPHHDAGSIMDRYQEEGEEWDKILHDHFFIRHQKLFTDMRNAFKTVDIFDILNASEYVYKGFINWEAGIILINN